jgi:hypothetical protein
MGSQSISSVTHNGCSHCESVTLYGCISGAVVIHDVPENSVVVGNLAAKIRDNVAKRVF